MQRIESLPSGAAIVHFAGGSFVSPWPTFRATSRRLALLELAVAARDKVRAAALAAVESDMAREARRRAKQHEGRALRWAPDGREHLDFDPAHLTPARAQGLPAYDGVEGRVYAPAPYRESAPRIHEAEPSPEAMGAMPVDVSYQSLTEAQAYQRAMAEDYLARAQAGDRDAAHTARRLLIKLHDDLARQDEAQAARDAIRNADAPARRYRREMIASLRASLEGRGKPRRAVLASLWGLRAALRDPTMQEWLDTPERGSDDGLRNMFVNKHLTLPEYLEGLRYRKVFIATERSLGSAINFERTGGREDNRPVEAWGAPQIERKRLEAIVINGAPNGRALTTLRLVAGQGRTISAISKARNTSDKILNRKALVLALKLLAEASAAT